MVARAKLNSILVAVLVCTCVSDCLASSFFKEHEELTAIVMVAQAQLALERGESSACSFVAEASKQEQTEPGEGFMVELVTCLGQCAECVQSALLSMMCSVFMKFTHKEHAEQAEIKLTGVHKPCCYKPLEAKLAGDAPHQNFLECAARPSPLPLRRPFHRRQARGLRHHPHARGQLRVRNFRRSRLCRFPRCTPSRRRCHPWLWCISRCHRWCTSMCHHWHRRRQKHPGSPSTPPPWRAAAHTVAW